MIPIVFAPDADSFSPGVLPLVQNFIPTDRGYYSAPTHENIGLNALAAACRGVYVGRDLSGVSRIYAGTSTAIYKATSPTWTDVKAAVYALGTNDRWSFAQFGNDTLAATITQALQKATTGNFAAIAGAPKAQIVLGTKDFVVLLHTDEGTFGNQTDRWWCSGYQDDTVWTPAVSTQCTTGRLIEGEGPITAGAVLGDDVIVFKRKAIFHGRYAGPPSVWNFTRVPGDFGCVGQEAVAKIGDKLCFIGDNDIFIYDGSRPYSIAEGSIKKDFSYLLDKEDRYKSICLYDWVKSNIWVFFPFESASTTSPTNAFVFNVTSKKWGYVATGAVEAALLWPDELDFIFDGNYKEDTPSFFNSSHVAGALIGTPSTGLMTTGYFGEEGRYSLLSGVAIRCQGSAPATATLTASAYDVIGEIPVGSSSSSIDDGKFDMRQSGRWHQLSLETTGRFEITSIGVDLKPEGRR
jgi:hypothetical protein